MKSKIYKPEVSNEESIIKMMIKDSATDKKTTRRRKKNTESEIRKRALEIYEMRISKGIPGNADSDWAQAEEELNETHT